MKGEVLWYHACTVQTLDMYKLDETYSLFVMEWNEDTKTRDILLRISERFPRANSYITSYNTLIDCSCPINLIQQHHAHTSP